MTLSLTCSSYPFLPHSGKSTVGSNLASALHLPFIDGDALHPVSNVQKMSSGIPLTDADRLPWLALIRSTAERVCREEFMKTVEGGEVGSDDGDWRGSLGRPAVVIACSALKLWYRDILRGVVDAEPPSKDNLVSLSLLFFSTSLAVSRSEKPRRFYIFSTGML
jgi:gluconokinase